MTFNSRHPAKLLALDFVELDRRALTTLSDSVFYFGELGMQEHRTSALLTDLLEEAGFTAMRGPSGFRTAFMATYGNGEPAIALHTELFAPRRYQ